MKFIGNKVLEVMVVIKKFFGTLIKWLAKCIIEINILLVRYCFKDKAPRLIFSLLKEFEKNSHEYYTYKTHFKKADFYVPSSIKTNNDNSELAIVLQGPIERKDSFTIETVKLYKKIFPHAIIICSTWSNSSKEDINLLKNLGCEVVLSETFENNGYGNINYQLHTTQKGIKRAIELGAKYILKNRSDIRIYREFSFDYLKNMLQMYPIAPNNVMKLKGRIISFQGFAGQMFMPFWLQDFLYFGYAEDLDNLFDIPYDDKTIKDRIGYVLNLFGEFPNGAQMASIPNAEIFITKSFVNKYVPVDNNVRTYWNLIKDIFVMLDYEDLNVFWFKYDRFRNLTRLYVEPGYYQFSDFYGLKKDDSRDPYKTISFADFVNIYCGSYQYEEWMEELRTKRRLY